MTAVARPRRSLLFVPADRPERMEKAARTPADAVILDLEDGVGWDHKENARDFAVSALSHLDFGRREVIVRVNGVGTPFLEADLAALADASRPPDAIVIPKVEVSSDVTAIERELIRRGCATGLIPCLESAAGILAAAAVARASAAVVALLFGGYDFAADVGARVAWGPLLPARGQIVLAAAAAGIEALDTPLVDYQDHDRLRQDCEMAHNLGFVGKAAIHPAQIEIINASFSPSAAEIEWARRVVDAMAAQDGGAIRLDGKMVDRATCRIALRHLAIADRLGAN